MAVASAVRAAAARVAAAGGSAITRPRSATSICGAMVTGATLVPTASEVVIGLVRSTCAATIARPSIPRPRAIGRPSMTVAGPVRATSATIARPRVAPRRAIIRASMALAGPVRATSAAIIARPRIPRPKAVVRASMALAGLIRARSASTIARLRAVVRASMAVARAVRATSAATITRATAGGPMAIVAISAGARIVAEVAGSVTGIATGIVVRGVGGSGVAGGRRDQAESSQDEAGQRLGAE